MDLALETIQKILLGLITITVVIYASAILIIGVEALTGDTSNLELMLLLLSALGLMYLCFFIGSIGNNQKQENLHD